MSRFIETIRAENSVIQHLELHQTRMSRTLRDHGISAIPDLAARIENTSIQLSGRVRIRIEYDTAGHLHIEQFRYMRKEIRSIRLMHISPTDYRYKYADRAWINALMKNSDADEILMIRDGLVTDASIANIVFFDGSDWWTPDTPLLKGTERSRLLEMGIIQERRISFLDFSDYLGFRLINAMLPWEDDITYDIAIINQH
jgi:4-amino-4-deoxychorismate lyase